MTRQLTGTLLAAGALTVAVGLPAIGDRQGADVISVAAGAGALLFQVALLALLALQDCEQAMTRPGGSGRIARVGYRIEAVILLGAMCSTILDAFWLIHGSVLWAVFDACWPLSMLGMVVIGIRVAIAGRWQGWLRWQTLFAQSWLLWGLPLSALGVVGLYVGAAQIVVGYGVLGGLLALRAPQASALPAEHPITVDCEPTPRRG